MSNSSVYDIFLDTELEKYYEELEEVDILWDDEPFIEPNTDYDNYDGWDDMQ